jgi:hypothetical protein
MACVQPSSLIPPVESPKEGLSSYTLKANSPQGDAIPRLSSDLEVGVGGFSPGPPSTHSPLFPSLETLSQSQVCQLCANPHQKMNETLTVSENQNFTQGSASSTGEGLSVCTCACICMSPTNVCSSSKASVWWCAYHDAGPLKSRPVCIYCIQILALGMVLPCSTVYNPPSRPRPAAQAPLPALAPSSKKKLKLHFMTSLR